MSIQKQVMVVEDLKKRILNITPVPNIKWFRKNIKNTKCVLCPYDSTIK